MKKNVPKKKSLNLNENDSFKSQELPFHNILLQ